MSKVSYETLTHSSCKPLALTRDLKAPATFLPLATFKRHSATPVPDSSKIHQVCKFWHMIQSHPIHKSFLSSPFNTMTLLSFALSLLSSSHILPLVFNTLDEFITTFGSIEPLVSYNRIFQTHNHSQTPHYITAFYHFELPPVYKPQTWASLAFRVTTLLGELDC